MEFENVNFTIGSERSDRNETPKAQDQASADVGKRVKRKYTKVSIEVNGVITVEQATELLAQKGKDIVKFCGNLFRDRVKIGGILKAAHEKLAKYEGGQDAYKAWVKDVLRMGGTDESNARRLHRITTGIHKADFDQLDEHYRNTLDYSLVEVALFAEESLKKAGNDEPPKKAVKRKRPKKICNLDSLRFDPSGIKIKCKDSDEETDITSYSVRKLRELLYPSPKSPGAKVPRQTTAALKVALQAAQERNEILERQIAELTELLKEYLPVAVGSDAGGLQEKGQSDEPESPAEAMDGGADGAIPPADGDQPEAAASDPDEPEFVLIEGQQDDPTPSATQAEGLGEEGIGSSNGAVS